MIFVNAIPIVSDSLSTYYKGLLDFEELDGEDLELVSNSIKNKKEINKLQNVKKQKGKGPKEAGRKGKGITEEDPTDVAVGKEDGKAKITPSERRKIEKSKRKNLNKRKKNKAKAKAKAEVTTNHNNDTYPPSLA